MDDMQCSRMPFWEEMTSEQRIEHLADVVRMLSRDSTFFSNDGGKTGYSIDDPKRKLVTFGDR